MSFFNKCKHKFGLVKKDGYQYCEKCGIAVCPKKSPCNHPEWEVIERNEYTFFGSPNGLSLTQKCKKCGKMEQKYIKPY